MSENWFKSWSLSTSANKILRRWKKTNPIYKHNKYTLFKQEYLFASERKLRYAISLVFLSILIYLNIEYGFNIVQSYVKTIYWKDSLTAFGIIYAAQVAIIAIAYPIVIGFVSIQLNQRADTQGYLKIYLIDSGAYIVAISSFTLIIFMTLQFFLGNLYAQEYFKVFISIDCLWFMYNLILTTNFLFSTYSYLDKDTQFNAIKQYLINVSLPTELKKSLLILVQLIAIEKNWITSEHETSKESEKIKPRVSLHSFSFMSGKEQINKQINNTFYISNIIFVPLRWAIKCWLSRAKKYTQNTKEGPLLEIFCTPSFTKKSGMFCLSRISNGPDLTRIEKILINLSVKITEVQNNFVYVNIQTILNDLVVELNKTCRDGDTDLFVQAYNKLVTLERDLFAACFFNLESQYEQLNNFACMDNSKDYGRLYDEWLRVYYTVFKKCLLFVGSDSIPIKKMFTIPSNIYSEEISNSPLSLQEKIISLPIHFINELQLWWASKVEEQGYLKHDHDHMVTLSLPLKKNYEQCFADFSSAWKRSKLYYARVPDVNNEFNWNNMSRSLRIHSKYISNIAILLAKSVECGDKTGAEWLVNLLVKSKPVDNDLDIFYLKDDYISINVFNMSWDEIKDTYINNNDCCKKLKNSKAMRYIYLTALINYWEDVQLLCIEYLISLIANDRYNCGEQSLVAYIVTGMFNGVNWRSGDDSAEQYLPTLQPQRLLTAKARRLNFKAGDNLYRQNISQLEEQLYSILPEFLQTNTTYGGRRSLDDQRRLFAEVLSFIILSSRDWAQHKEVQSIYSMLNTNSSDSLSVYLNLWIKRLESLSNTSDISAEEAVVIKFLKLTNKKHTIQEGIQRTICAFNRCLQDLNNK